MAGLVLRSSAFDDHDLIPRRFSREGGNVSPPLEWSGVPDGTTELVLLCEDPDAGPPSFVHWLVTGIDPASTGVPEAQVPRRGREWPNGFGSTGWGGPHPPVGDDPHRYVFRVYAAGEPVTLKRHPQARDVHAALDDDALASGTLVGLFGR